MELRDGTKTGVVRSFTETGSRVVTEDTTVHCPGWRQGVTKTLWTGTRYLNRKGRRRRTGRGAQHAKGEPRQKTL